MIWLASIIKTTIKTTINIIENIQSLHIETVGKDIEEITKKIDNMKQDLEIEKKQQKIKEMKGEQLDNGWGSQIRSYVFHPYNLVKDARTGHETSQVTQIMDGNIDEFIYAYLRWELSQ